MAEQQGQAVREGPSRVSIETGRPVGKAALDRPTTPGGGVGCLHNNNAQRRRPATDHAHAGSTLDFATNENRKERLFSNLGWIKRLDGRTIHAHASLASLAFRSHFARASLALHSRFAHASLASLAPPVSVSRHKPQGPVNTLHSSRVRSLLIIRPCLRWHLTSKISSTADRRGRLASERFGWWWWWWWHGVVMPSLEQLQKPCFSPALALR